MRMNSIAAVEFEIYLPYL